MEQFDTVAKKAQEILEECPDFDSVIIIVDWNDKFNSEKLPICAIEGRQDKDVRTQTQRILDALLRTIKSVVAQQMSMLSQVIQKLSTNSAPDGQE